MTSEGDALAIRAIQSAEELQLLDAIDRLRSQGLSHYISLPQLIVCGDQSSGKSSVLEAISRIPFPRNEGLCTRFATEVILRRTSVTSVAVGIVPSETRSKSEIEKLGAFRRRLENFDGFGALYEEAKKVMGIGNDNIGTPAFSDDVLRIEISGPDRPHLTIVDLPGVIHSATGVLTQTDVDIVHSMVKRYMADGRSIILAVLSAKNDIANQVILKLCSEIDGKGSRTLGIITKPDEIKKDSQSETDFLKLARNEDIHFALGWHVLRNRDHKEASYSSEERDAKETTFFSEGIWRSFSKKQVGVGSLTDRLSRVLLTQIRKELPALLAELQSKVDESEAMLQKLGDRRGTVAEQRKFLMRISQAFQSLVICAKDGEYYGFSADKFELETSADCRLRARLQQLCGEFSATMLSNGHSRQITEDEDDEPSTPTTDPGSSTAAAEKPSPSPIARATFVDEIKELMGENKGRELPGMYNPLIVGDLFHKQATPWAFISRDHIEATWTAANQAVKQLLSKSTDGETHGALMREVVTPQMNLKKEKMLAENNRLLYDVQKIHPITYNDHFTENLQKKRNERMLAGIEETNELFISNLPDLDCNPKWWGKKELSAILRNALKSIKERVEQDMDNFAANEILDSMDAFYKVIHSFAIHLSTISSVHCLKCR